MKRRDFLTAGALLAMAGPALAQQGGKTGPNGGPISLADGHPIEMIATEAELAFFIQDEDGKPLDTKGVSGRAVVTQGGKNSTIQLAAAAPNKLAGPLPAPLTAGAKVVFSTKLHGHNLQARFEKK